MIEVIAPLWLWSGAKRSWHFLTVPAEQAAEVRLRSLASGRGFGSVRVEARIGDVAWRTSLFPERTSGGYLLPVKAEVRRSAGVTAGEEVEVRIELL